MVEVRRFGPIVVPDIHPSLGSNINGPSLLRAPDWVEDPLGRYYLYFADHKGSYIRLAHADEVTGPYTVFEPGSLDLRSSQFPTEVPPGIEPRTKVQADAIAAEGYDAHFFRHCALLRRRDVLHVFWTRAGDAPEHILRSTVGLDGEWTTWTPSEPESVLAPEESWEGAELPLRSSVRGQVTTPVRELRDPAIFAEDGRVWLLYTVAGESGIAIAELSGV